MNNNPWACEIFFFYRRYLFSGTTFFCFMDHQAFISSSETGVNLVQSLGEWTDMSNCLDLICDKIKIAIAWKNCWYKSYVNKLYLWVFFPSKGFTETLTSMFYNQIKPSRILFPIILYMYVDPTLCILQVFPG